MKPYNFNCPPDRRGTESVKWDLYPGTLPLWVADMDFPVAPEIAQALQKRLDHGVFGYELVPDEYFTVMAEWFRTRHGWEGISRENTFPTTGVIPAYSAAMKAFTRPGDKVVVLTPCYNAFFPPIRSNGCVQVDSPLRYEGGLYTVDWEDLEKKAKGAAALLLSNPHNPVGRVWTREELLHIGDICLKHNLLVISDEIHCELTFPGFDYTPWATLPEKYVQHSVSCISPTKPFNIAGIQIANLYAADPEHFRKASQALHDMECDSVNVFGVAALKAAYGQGGPWLDALREYLLDHARTTSCYLEDHLPGIDVAPLEGTYLMWLDCRRALRPGEPLEGFSERLFNHLKDRHGLTLSCGSWYGKAGEGFQRLNIACPRTRLLDGLQRLQAGLESYRKMEYTTNS
jgi:cystathionine beta-lyase